MRMTGGCLCGAVRYTVDAEPAFAGYCHCPDCRRSSGAGHCCYIGVPRTAFVLTGDVRGHTVTGGSGLPTTRFFCPTCGSQLYGRPDAAPDHYTLYAGSLDDPLQFVPREVINTRHRAPWDVIAGGLPEHEGMP
ncbi:MAG: GFA family protein [Geminicoccaceae bacterium]